MKDREIKFVDASWIDQAESTLIYNRYDMWEEPVDFKVISVTDSLRKNTRYFPVRFEKKSAELGVWGMQISREELNEISVFLFQSQVRKVKVLRAEITGKDVLPTTNDFIVSIPENEESIDRYLTKKERYNLKRQIRQCVSSYGEVSFTDYKADEQKAQELVRLFWKFKKESHGSVYLMSEDEYIRRYHISNVYELKFGDTVAAVLLSCEQGKDVFLENFSFDHKLSKWSPGMIIYNLYLKKLVKKQKSRLFLGGGEYAYKRKYGSTEHFVYEETLYASCMYKIKDRGYSAAVKLASGILPKGVIRMIHNKRNPGS